MLLNHRMAVSVLAAFLLLTSCAVLDEISRPADANGGQTSSERVAQGLREALLVASERASDQVGRSGGYLDNENIRIPLPRTLQNAATQLRRFGLGGKADELQRAMNRAAEAAADEAVPVFADSIRQMRPADVFAVLKGGDDAATQYLRRTSEDALRERYRPIVAERLEQVEGVELYREIATTWNRLPGVQPLEADLETFVTDQALDGLFSVIASEEQRIRNDPVARTTRLLRDVFGSR